MAEIIIERTLRGFGVYADLKDNYQQRIRVQESSAASGNFCWIFIGDTEDSYGAHLNVEQARTVADALLGWIADVAQRNAEETEAADAKR